MGHLKDPPWTNQDSIECHVRVGWCDWKPRGVCELFTHVLHEMMKKKHPKTAPEDLGSANQ